MNGPGVLEDELGLHRRERARAVADLPEGGDVAPADLVLVEHHRHRAAVP